MCGCGSVRAGTCSGNIFGRDLGLLTAEMIEHVICESSEFLVAVRPKSGHQSFELVSFELRTMQQNLHQVYACRIVNARRTQQGCAGVVDAGAVVSMATCAGA